MKHLTIKQRYKIESLLELNSSKSEISRKLSICKSVLSRELKRNMHPSGKYCACYAQNEYKLRKQLVGKEKKYLPEELEMNIINQLEHQFSPEQINGNLKKAKKETRSHSWIYKYIWKDKEQGGNLYKNLRSGKKKRKKYGVQKDKRGKIKNRISIEKRPKIVEDLIRIGDWEADTIIGKDHKGVIVSLTERRSMTQLLKKVESKNARQVSNAIIEMVRGSKLPAYTMTFDNGKEFSEHERIGRLLNLQTFFCHPYSSFERGLNENHNGLVRQYIPKKTPFAEISQQQVKRIEELLNIRPRKSLGFYSPKEYVNIELDINYKTKITLENKSYKSPFYLKDT